jgi:hypothetical protein
MGQAHVVRVHVGDQYAQDGQALQNVLFKLQPSFAGAGVVNAAVHSGPAFLHDTGLGGVWHAVTQQPQIDVVQGKRQTHAQPENAWRDLHG